MTIPILFSKSNQIYLPSPRRTKKPRPESGKSSTHSGHFLMSWHYSLYQ
jgi:hypothetical protein